MGLAADMRLGVFFASLGAALLACRMHPNRGNADREPDARVMSDTQPTYVLDAEHPTAIYAIGSEPPNPAGQKFIEIVISRIVNPKRRRLLFGVSYRPRRGDEVQLGQFGPFPSDRPGTFIVATRGLLRRRGTIVVTLVPLDSLSVTDSVRVDLGSIRLRRE